MLKAVCKISEIFGLDNTRVRQYKGFLPANSTHWMVRKEEIELTGLEFGMGAGRMYSHCVAKFIGMQVAVKRIHDEIFSHLNFHLFR